MNSPLAKALYGIDDFITVTKSEDAPWDILKPEIFAAIMDFYSSGKPLFLDANTAASMDTAITENCWKLVSDLQYKIGGDIEYRGFDPDTGIVKLRMQGACSGCPSKSGIENMLMHYVPEVKAVEQELDDEDEAATLPDTTRKYSFGDHFCRLKIFWLPKVVELATKNYSLKEKIKIYFLSLATEILVGKILISATKKYVGRVAEGKIKIYFLSLATKILVGKILISATKKYVGRGIDSFGD
ncbi:hypothetical protein HYC85_004462 [Camellia sinensis]|uniref:Scaffold protein Nfu/NifU N-terminal domain-containing protein n=1 Tax=Camellia sinensis TaxID=4442 RepID=A0A7J7HXV4_CAMSI|nr:hypothetical protein HYC85_004462 [Camellia sinensis]